MSPLTENRKPNVAVLLATVKRYVLRLHPQAWAEKRGGRWFVFRPDEWTGTGWASMASGDTEYEAWEQIAKKLHIDGYAKT